MLSLFCGTPSCDGRLDRTPGCTGNRWQQLGKLNHLLCLIAQRGTKQLSHAQLIAIGPPSTRRLDPAWFRRQVKDAIGHGHGCLAVDRRVVHLGIKTKAAIGQALNDIELPQRPAAIKQTGMQAGGQSLQLRHRAWLGQHQIAHVVVQIDVVVGDPNWVGQVKRH